MSARTESRPVANNSHSILEFSHGAVTAFRYFSKEDFLHMMYDMSIEEIQMDLKRFQAIGETRICRKLKFVINEKKKIDSLDVENLL